MQNIEVLAKELSAADIADIKANLEAFAKEYVAAIRGLRAKGQLSCGMSPNSSYGCNTCKAVFVAARVDANYCPACGGSELKVLSLDEIVEHHIGHKISNMLNAQDETEIKELWSQGLSKKAIADKLGIRIGDVSDIVGIKKRELPQEKIDYIRNAHLAGRSDWDIKETLGRVSEERIEEVIADLCSEIREAYLKGVRPEDMGEIFGVQGTNQVIIDHVNSYIKWGKLPAEPGLPPLTNEEMRSQFEKHWFKLESPA